MVVTFNLNKKTFMVYLIYFRAKILIYLACKTRIALLVAKKKFILAEYLDFSNIFIKKLIAKLSKHFNINKYEINLKVDKQLPYGPIYNLKPIELKIFKIYIKTNLANGFI